MTMDANELRALADALEPMAKAPRFEDFDVPAFCAWVRAQADAQPVAWIARNLTTGRVKWTTDRCRARGWTRDANLRVKLLYAHPAPAVPAGWQLVPVNPTPEMLASTSWPGCAGTDYAHMLAAAPAAPQAEPIDPHMIVADDRFPDEQAEPKREPRPCTCHPDDNPPVPCAQKYALNECRATRSGPDEAQIEARDALLDFISENGTASEGVQHYLDRYVRAALAAKEQK